MELKTKLKPFFSSLFAIIILLFTVKYIKLNILINFTYKFSIWRVLSLKPNRGAIERMRQKLILYVCYCSYEMLAFLRWHQFLFNDNTLQIENLYVKLMRILSFMYLTVNRWIIIAKRLEKNGFTPVNQTILPFSELVCVLLYGWT